MAVADADGFAAIASQGRTVAEMVMIYLMTIGRFINLDLQCGRIGSFSGEMVMINPVFTSEEMDIELAGGIGDRAISQAAGLAFDSNGVVRGACVLEPKPGDNEMAAGDVEV